MLKFCDRCGTGFPEEKLTRVYKNGRYQYLCRSCIKNIGWTN